MISRNENIFNDINKWAECTDGNEAFNFFKDFSWRIYLRGSFSPEALGLYSLIFSLIKDLSIQNNDPMLYLVAKKPDKYNYEKRFFVRCAVNTFSAAAFGTFISFMVIKHLK